MLPKELEEIVHGSGLDAEPKPLNKPTALKVVAYQGKNYKVRKYSNIEEARRQEELLVVANSLFTHCYGRHDKYLVLQYLNKGSQEHHSKNYLTELGEFLGELSNLEPGVLDADKFDSWIDDLISSGVLLTPTIELIKRHYNSRTDQSKIDWDLEYFDAMPRNFVLDHDKLISIDEKHLGIGPKGLSLIKPMWELSPRDFKSVLEGYKSRTGFTGFEDPAYREFLLFYYIVYSLAFVGTHKSKRANIRISEFHRRRHQLLKIVGTSLGVRLREQAWWVLIYCGYRSWGYLKAIPMSIANRISSFQRVRPDAQT